MFKIDKKANGIVKVMALMPKGVNITVLIMKIPAKGGVDGLNVTRKQLYKYG